MAKFIIYNVVSCVISRLFKAVGNYFAGKPICDFLIFRSICINDKRFLSAGFIINFQNDYLSVWKNYFCNFYNANRKIIWK